MRKRITDEVTIQIRLQKLDAWHERYQDGGTLKRLRPQAALR